LIQSFSIMFVKPIKSLSSIGIRNCTVAVTSLVMKAHFSKLCTVGNAQITVVDDQTLQLTSISASSPEEKEPSTYVSVPIK